LAMTVAVAAVITGVGKRGGGHRYGSNQDSDFLGEHCGLLSSVRCNCISRAWAPQVNR